MLARAGLAPVTLGPKEGITLINGTQAHTGIAALAIVDAHRLWQVAHLAGAMSLEALLGTPVAFDARIQDVRGQLGQAASAALLRELLRDSEIRESHRHGDPRVQDQYSLRCMPQVHGPVLDAIASAPRGGPALNAATGATRLRDAVTAERRKLPWPVGGDGARLPAIALTNLATIAERRIDRLVNPDLNRDAPFLTRDPG